jgi:hypothetical protein
MNDCEKGGFSAFLFFLNEPIAPRKPEIFFVRERDKREKRKAPPLFASKIVSFATPKA